MKTYRYLLFAVFALAVILIVTRRSTAQTAAAPDTNSPPDKFTLLASSLNNSGETNVLNQVSSLLADKAAETKTIDIACTLKVLRDLRTGNTNEAIELLESKLDDALVGYETLPRLAGTKRMIELAKQYREEFPHKTDNASVDAAVERTLNYNSGQ